MNQMFKSFLLALFLYMALVLGAYFIWKFLDSDEKKEKVHIDPTTLSFKKAPTTQQAAKSAPSTPSKPSKTEPTKPSKPTKTPQAQPKPKPVPPPKELGQKRFSKPKPLPNEPQTPKELTQSLLSNLPKPQKQPKRLTPEQKLAKELYGDGLNAMTATQREYIEDNLLKMQSITQDVLNRIGKMYLDPRYQYYNHNYVEFILYPDGSISDLTMLREADFKILDEITQETIQTAYKDYPRPKEPTRIRFKFLYDLRAY